MKRTPNLVRQMWICFAHQLVTAICISTFFIFVAVLMLRTTKDSSNTTSHYLPKIRERLDAEQDPVKLRKEANSWLDVFVNQQASQEDLFRFFIKTYAVFGFGLFAFTMSLGIFAYRLQRQNRDEVAST